MQDRDHNPASPPLDLQYCNSTARPAEPVGLCTSAQPANDAGTPIGQCTSPPPEAAADPGALSDEEALKAIEQQILADLNRDSIRPDLRGVSARHGLQVAKPFVDWMTDEGDERGSAPPDILNVAVDGLVSMIDALASKHQNPIYAQQMIVGRIGQLLKARNKERIVVARSRIIMPGA